MTGRSILVCALAALAWGCVFALQRPAPRYSQQYMPQTSFSCRNKIIGSYYADPETDCQLFHVCVSVAGSVQDYRFLCPNDTAFDQESQTCADWYDVDCEAATLYYASDNFDLYRIGSGLESLHYDSIRSDYEPQDHLQRSESNDPIRSPYNANNNYGSANSKDVDAPPAKKSNSFRNNNENQYNSRQQKQYEPEKENNKPQEQQQQQQQFEKKNNFRKVSRKPTVTTTTRQTTTTTAAPPPTTPQAARYNPNQAFVYSTTTQRASSVNTPKITYQTPSSTQRPTTKYTVPVTTLRSTEVYTNYQTSSTAKSTYQFNGFNRFETTAKPTQTTHYTEQQQPNYSAQYTTSQQALPSTTTTKQPVYDYQQQHQQQNYNNYESTKQNVNVISSYNNPYSSSNYNNNYNNYNSQRTNVTSYPSTTAAPNQYPNHNYDNVNNNNYQQTSKKADYNQNTYTANTYAPTTYSPVTKKFPNHRNFFDKSSSSGLTTKNAQYSSADTESTKATKKATQFKNYPSQFEASTRSYDFGRSSVGLGFSPSSVNHLAENVRPTTPTPRRAAPTTYNPNSFNVNTQSTQPKQQQQQPQQSYYQSQAAAAKQQQYTTTSKYYEQQTSTPRPAKISKKNDYDYAYYDNDPSAYDNIELEHVNSNKESVKIT